MQREFKFAVMSLISNIGKEINACIQKKKLNKLKLPDVKREKKIHVQYLLCQ